MAEPKGSKETAAAKSDQPPPQTAERPRHRCDISIEPIWRRLSLIASPA